MQLLYAISLQWLDEIIPAITNSFGEIAAAVIRILDFGALSTWVTNHAVFIIGAILLALWLNTRFRKSP
jgi:hypothetical protein